MKKWKRTAVERRIRGSGRDEAGMYKAKDLTCR
jgi:hypothetical protein